MKENLIAVESWNSLCLEVIDLNMIGAMNGIIECSIKVECDQLSVGFCSRWSCGQQVEGEARVEDINHEGSWVTASELCVEVVDNGLDSGLDFRDGE